MPFFLSLSFPALETLLAPILCDSPRGPRRLGPTSPRCQVSGSQFPELSSRGVGLAKGQEERVPPHLCPIGVGGRVIFRRGKGNGVRGAESPSGPGAALQGPAAGRGGQVGGRGARRGRAGGRPGRRERSQPRTELASERAREAARAGAVGQAAARASGRAGGEQRGARGAPRSGRGGPSGEARVVPPPPPLRGSGREPDEGGGGMDPRPGARGR